MIKFLIHHPRFAGVIFTVISIAGTIALLTLPVSQYPEIAPPEIAVDAIFPGANSETVKDTVATIIEQEVNGVEGMIYMKSTSSNDGTYSLVVTFEIGSDADKAQVLVQNRVNKSLPELPEQVRRQGIVVEKMSSNMVLALAIYSDDPKYDNLFLSNYATLNVQDTLKRIPGVGKASILGEQKYSMRVWLDPVKMAALEITVADVTRALGDQNVIAAAGQIGAYPSSSEQKFQYVVQVESQLKTEEQFGAVILHTTPDGANIYMRDIARIEVGGQQYLAIGKLGDKPAAILTVYQQPGSNALQVSQSIHQLMEDIAPSFPEGVNYAIPYDTTRFVESAIFEVYETLIIAVLLVILVTYLFLQDWRSTLIPTLTIPVSLVGTFAVMMMLGMSINILSLFGLILAIGIVVDAAIIILESVERLMEEGMDPESATLQAMKEVMSPLLASALVLLAVFGPVSVMPGLVGKLYSEFGIVLAVSVVISTFVAIVVTPPLCVMLLREEKPKPFWFLRKFNEGFEKFTNGYVALVGVLARRLTVTVLLFAILLGVTGWLASATPSGFVPEEDIGGFFVEFQLPDAAALVRTDDAMDRIARDIADIPGVEDSIVVSGYSLLNSATAPNTGIMIVALEPWSSRPLDSMTQGAIMGQVNDILERYNEGVGMTFAPPAIPGLGMASGFEFMLQDRLARSPQELANAMEQTLAAANQQADIGAAFATFRADVPRIFLDVDREKTQAFGVSLQDVFSTLQAQLGAAYINNTNIFGRNAQVNIQADAPFRSSVEDINQFYVRSDKGELVPLSSMVSSRSVLGPQNLTRYNLYNAVQILGGPAPGKSSGQAVAAMERIAETELPSGFGFEWTGTTYQEIAAGNAATIAFALAILFAYLFLVAQFESLMIPLAIILIVPTALLGSFIHTLLAGGNLSVFTQIGLVLMIGMASRNAILMVEFAKEKCDNEGMGTLDAAMASARLRFRPLWMTGSAFILGVFPLVIASGAGEAARQALGVSVFGGMLSATLIGAILTPPLFTLVQNARNRVHSLHSKKGE